MIFSDLKFL